MFKIALAISVIGFVMAVTGCASGSDGLRQGCSDANSALTAAFKVITGEMKDREAKGDAKKFLSCFESAVGTLNSFTDAKDAVCCQTKDANGNCVIPDNLPKQTFSDYAAKAMAIAPQVGPIVANFHSCMTTLSGGK